MAIEKRWEHGEEIFTPVCDGCGDELADEYDFYDAVDAKKLAGWRTIVRNARRDLITKTLWAILQG